MGKVLLLVAAVAAWGGGSVRAPAAEDGAEVAGTVALRNGDRFQARIQALDPEAGMATFRHPLVRKPIEFQAAALRRFDAANRPATAAKDNGWKIETNTGDRWYGEILRMDARHLAFKNDAAGTFEIPRDRIVAILNATASRAIYEGPKPGDEWVRERANFKVSGTRVEIPPNQMGGLKLPSLPRRARIDLTLRSPSLALVIGFYGESVVALNDGGGEGYLLQIMTGALNLIRRRGTGVTHSVGIAHFNPGSISPAKSLAVTILTDLDRRRISVLFNGRSIASWTDPAIMNRAGSILAFSSFQWPLEVSKIRVADWDGVLPGEEIAAAPDGTDVLRLRNDDVIAGKVLAIADSKCTIRSPIGEIAVALANINRMDFAADRAPAAKSDVLHLSARDGSWFRLRRLSIAAGHASGENPDIGRVRIPLSELRTILWPEAPGDAPAETENERETPEGFQ